jgi:hypothetical protein
MPLNNHSPAYAVMFALGGALFVLAGVIRQELEFQPKWDALGIIGGAFMVYALAYPGHRRTHRPCVPRRARLSEAAEAVGLLEDLG